MAKISRAEFEDFNERFTAAFNNDDLDGVMSLFAEDGLYAEFNGAEHCGKKAIREAFEPQFRGEYGPVRFHAEDAFVDEETGKAVSRWRCTAEIDGKPQEFKGLDIYRLEDGLIKEKLTYAQTPWPLMKEI
jgi:uncharacterized protein (TIGR02246 family)